jgi:hypothetical protein
MQMVLGDIRWLVDGFPRCDKRMEVVVMVVDNGQAVELPITAVRIEKKLIITCSLPKGAKAPKQSNTKGPSKCKA